GGIKGGGTLKNTIVANNFPGGNCAVVGVSAGHNLSSDGSCGFTAPGDLNNTDPMLGPLTNNGGPTETHALLAGSPAIDAGSGDCPPAGADQRGIVRAQGAACDIGAYEATGCIHAAPGLVGWWPLDETSGTTVTEVVSGRNGTALPGPIGGFAGSGPVT